MGKTHAHPGGGGTHMELDEVDWKILKILQSDGRIALSEIARRLDMGSATIHERVDKLEQDGFIREYRAVLDGELLGIDQVAFIRVRTETDQFSEVAERLAEVDDLQEIHEVTGDTDLLLKSRVRTQSDLTDLLHRIGEFEGVRATGTDVALRSVKEEQKLNLDGR